MVSLMKTHTHTQPIPGSCSRAPLLLDRMFLHDGPEEEEEDEGFFMTHSLEGKEHPASVTVTFS